MKASKDLWNDDRLQFARLISEMHATCEISPKDFEALCVSMDLTKELVNELIDRALRRWETAKTPAQWIGQVVCVNCFATVRVESDVPKPLEGWKVDEFGYTHCPKCQSFGPKDKDSKDQMAHVMLVHGTPEQQQEALAYAGTKEPHSRALSKKLRTAEAEVERVKKWNNNLIEENRMLKLQVMTGKTR